MQLHSDRAVTELLSRPLRERVGEDVREAANEWSFVADTRYRASTELREVDRGRGLVRIGVKDIVDVAGFATRLGLRRYRHHPAMSARVLREVSGITVNAKVVSTELGIGLEHGCVNPYFPEFDPSGSSTGCAVAVAANICDVALGTDTVASVRLPAAACGVVGLRLTQRAGQLGGVFRLSRNLDAPGWIARTPDDLAYFWDEHVTRTVHTTRSLRIGVVDGLDDDGCAPEILSVLADVRDALVNAGHEMTHVRIDDLLDRRGSVYQLCTRAAWQSYQRWRHRIDDVLSESTVLALEAGAKVDDETYDEALRALRACRATVAERFTANATDLWLLPVQSHLPRNLRTTPPPASTIPDFVDPVVRRRLGYSSIATFAGLPSITFPVALEPTVRAPVSLQAIGLADAERDLIGFAQHVSELVGAPRFSTQDGVGGPGE